MRLVDQIVPPFESYEDIEELVEIFQNMDEDEIQNEDMYEYTVSEPMDEETIKAYYKEFHKNIEIPACSVLYKTLKKVDPILMDEYVEKRLLEEESDSAKERLKRSHFYPAKEYFKVLKYFPTYERLDAACESIKNKNPEKVRESLNKQSEEMRRVVDISIKFHTLIKERFHSPGLAGFHINPLLFFNEDKTEKDEAKLYLNAGIDSYKVALLFQNKCVNNNINYYFKVLCKGEFDRKEKICIYTEIEHIPKFVEIIREIIKEHPEIKFKKSSLLCGYIDGVIGIGTDYFGEYRDSYNRKMSSLCARVFKEVFEEVGYENSLEYYKENPYLWQIIRLKIGFEARNMGLSYNYICLKDEDIERLNKIEKKEKEF